MKMFAISLALAARAANSAPAWADSSKTYTVKVPRHVRTEIYLSESKPKTVAATDQLSGKNTCSRALEQREAAKPRLYIPHKIKVKGRPRAQGRQQGSFSGTTPYNCPPRGTEEKLA